MHPAPINENAPVQNVLVYAAQDFRVIEGADHGDPLSFAAELTGDSVYALTHGAEPAQLSIQVSNTASGTAQLNVARDSAIGTAGAALILDCTLTLMSPDGHTTEGIVLVELDTRAHVRAVMLLALGALAERVPYTLIGVDRSNALHRFGDVACARFARGTHITLASGAQAPIETLRPGARILTRDNGVQELRWIAPTTVRAVGDFAPINIRAGTLNNSRDLRLSPDHRLFIYQRADALGAGRAAVLVRARHLVNGDSVTRQDGGFVDYFQLLFDAHQIVFAEGIAAESTLIDLRTQSAVPAEIAATIQGPGHINSTLSALEVQARVLNRPDAAELLRRASANDIRPIPKPNLQTQNAP